jgi:hypothetical protein
MDLKCRKLENRALEQQHQHKREQHEICMMQMQLIMSQNQQGMLEVMQVQTSLGGFGLLGALDLSLVSGSLLASSFSM